MAGIGDVALAAGGNGGLLALMGPDKSRTTTMVEQVSGQHRAKVGVSGVLMASLVTPQYDIDCQPGLGTICAIILCTRPLEFM